MGAKRVRPTSATLGGIVNPNGKATTWYIEYGTTIPYAAKTPVADAGSGTLPKSVSAVVRNLLVGRTYHFRLVATNSAGTRLGADATFVTAEPPSVQTTAASSVGSTSVQLNASVNPNGGTTKLVFEYGTTIEYGSKTKPANVGSGTFATNVKTIVTGLRPLTKYHYRVVATSSSGTRRGTDRTFVTPSLAPTVATSAATGIATRAATLRGTLNPNGSATTWYYEYGQSTSYGRKTPLRKAGAGSVFMGVAATVTNLSPGTVYHFRLVAKTEKTTIRGSDATFVTLGPPRVKTGSVDTGSLSLFSAQVRGSVNSLGLSATWWFEYGPTRSYGFRTLKTATGGSADVQVTSALQRLTPGKRWHYRLVSQSAIGTTVGADASFRTSPQPRDPAGKPVECTIVGTESADVLRGTSGNDVICGLGGNDKIYGLEGSDVIYGGNGDDILIGGRNSDILRGGAGNDDLRARDGTRDLVEGGPGVDKALVDRSLDRAVSVEKRRFK